MGTLVGMNRHAKFGRLELWFFTYPRTKQYSYGIDRTGAIFDIGHYSFGVAWER
jgi:hypothetical protein